MDSKVRLGREKEARNHLGEHGVGPIPGELEELLLLIVICMLSIVTLQYNTLCLYACKIAVMSDAS